jgi:hypothetical protein
LIGLVGVDTVLAGEIAPLVPILNDCTEVLPLLATNRNDPDGSTARLDGPAPTANGEPDTAASAPVESTA